jgi:tetratricopeptide (TPR) repeat protein
VAELNNGRIHIFVRERIPESAFFMPEFQAVGPSMSQTPSSPKRRPILLAALLLVLAGIAVYANSLHAPFYFDDDDGIVKNVTLRTLRPISIPLSPPAQTTLAGRPLVNLSLALNYAVSGTNVWSYHVGNLLIHLLAGLALFGVVRRTLLTPRLASRFGRHSTVLACLVALLWIVHPLQTESVTYIVQRTESMVGLFYLLTLYAFIRGATSPRRLAWYAISVAACAAGMASKEVMVTAPLMVLLYDRVFLAVSWKETFGKRFSVYVAMAFTWGVLFSLAAGNARSMSAGLGFGMTPWQYASSQFGVVLHYLRLCFWPHPLILDYGLEPPTSAAEIAPPAVAIVLLLAATAWALWKRPAAGFCGAWFFLTLAPTSSILPIADLCFEHRVYLGLAGVAALLVCGVYTLGQSVLDRLSASPSRRRLAGIAGLTLVLAATCGFGAATVLRNAEYNDPVAFHINALQYTPDNPRTLVGLGTLYLDRGQLDEAATQFRKAIKANPEYPPAMDNLALVLSKQGKFEEVYALLDSEIAIYRRLGEKRIDLSELAMVHFHYAMLLESQGRIREALHQYQSALQLAPGNVDMLSEYANALQKAGKTDEAVATLNEALRLNGNSSRAHYVLGSILLAKGKTDDALEHLRKSVECDTSSPEAHNRLGEVLLRKGRREEAATEFRRAIELREAFTEAYFNLASLAAMKGDLPAAERQYRRVIELAPKFAPAQAALGMTLLRQHRPAEAVECYRAALTLGESPAAMNDLAWVLATCGDEKVRNAPEALRLARRACELTQRKEPTFLDTLAAAQAQTGDFAAAEATMQEAISLAEKAGNKRLAVELAARLEVYKARKTYTEAP